MCLACGRCGEQPGDTAAGPAAGLSLVGHPVEPSEQLQQLTLLLVSALWDIL